MLRLNYEGLSHAAIVRRTDLHRGTVRRIIDDAARRYWAFWVQRQWLDDVTDPHEN